MKKFMIVMAACMLAGCAIDSDLKQKKSDISVVKVGAKQYEIENQLGNALETKTEGNTKSCVYYVYYVEWGNYYVKSGDPIPKQGILQAMGDYALEISGHKGAADEITKFKFTITYLDDVCTNIKVLPLETENPGDSGKGIENRKP
jgi:hypothetical protein